MSQRVPVGIFAASSVVGPVELAAGLDHLRRHGFDPRVEPQVAAEHFLFAGSDEVRAEAVYRLATDPAVRVLWAARGGYGATRLLPLLDRLARERGAPPAGKLLVGYSDVTVLHEFARARWGWHTLHAPMPGSSTFPSLPAAEWRAIVDYVNGGEADAPWAHAPLQWITGPPAGAIDAELVGGNLSLLAATAGTPYATRAAGKILFVEDVDEPFYRIDRMVVQLEQSGALASAAAVVLGDFTRCADEDHDCLADAATGERRPLRAAYDQPEAFRLIFGELGRRIGVPVAHGLPVGHGPHYAPLPLGARYELTPAGKLRLVRWNWAA